LPPVPAAQGFFPWTIPPDFFTTNKEKQRYPDPYEVGFVLAYPDGAKLDGQGAVFGPAVYITTGSVSPGGDGSGKTTHAAAIIAAPVAIAAMLALIAAFCVVSWRRTGHLPLIGLIGGGLAARIKKGRRRGSSGYGVRQSRSERVASSSTGSGGGGGGGGGVGGVGSGDHKSETNADGIQLTDRDSWSATAGGRRNVFREEVERQARLG
jgi:hypothetical protein